MDDIKIGEAIRIERQRKGISQEAMAFALNISQPAYSKIESGETELTVNRSVEIAKIFRLPGAAFTPLSGFEIPVPETSKSAWRSGGLGGLAKAVGAWMITGWNWGEEHANESKVEDGRACESRSENSQGT